MGAGAAKRDARIWEEFLQDADVALPWSKDTGLTFQMHKPQKGGTKWPAETFAAITGYKGRTSDLGIPAKVIRWNQTTPAAPASTAATQPSLCTDADFLIFPGSEDQVPDHRGTRQGAGG